MKYRSYTTITSSLVCLLALFAIVASLRAGNSPHAQAEEKVESEAHEVDGYTINPTEKTITGVVRDQDGKPIAGATLWGYPIVNPANAMGEAYIQPKYDGSPPRDFKAAFLAQSNPRQVVAANYARKAISAEDGSYELKDLGDVPYQIYGYRKGYHRNNKFEQVQPGDEYSLSLSKFVMLEVTLTLPDGSEPKEAQIATRMHFGHGHSSGYSYRWTPEDRNLPLAQGVWKILARTPDEEFASQSLNLDLLSNSKSSNTSLELKRRTGLQVTLPTRDEIWSRTEYYVEEKTLYALPEEVEDFDKTNIAELGLELFEKQNPFTYRTNYLRADIPAGEYKLLLLTKHQLTTLDSFTIREGKLTKVDVVTPEPTRKDYVIVSTDGLDAVERSQLQISSQVRVVGSAQRLAYRGEVIRKQDGKIWVPIPRVTPSMLDRVPAGEKLGYFVHASSKVRGEALVEFEVGEESVATLKFAPMAMLKVRVEGFDARIKSHREAHLYITEPDPADEDEKKSAYQYSYYYQRYKLIDLIDDQGILYIPGLSLGDRVLKLSILFTGYRNPPLLALPLKIERGVNEASIEFPDLYTLNIERGESALGERPLYVSLYRDGVLLGSQRETPSEPATFENLVEGEYEIRYHFGGKEHVVKFTLSEDKTITIEGK